MIMIMKQTSKSSSNILTVIIQFGISEFRDEDEDSPCETRGSTVLPSPLPSFSSNRQDPGRTRKTMKQELQIVK